MLHWPQSGTNRMYISHYLAVNLFSDVESYAFPILFLWNRIWPAECQEKAVTCNCLYNYRVQSKQWLHNCSFNTWVNVFSRTIRFATNVMLRYCMVSSKECKDRVDLYSLSLTPFQSHATWCTAVKIILQHWPELLVIRSAPTAAYLGKAYLR